MQYKFPDINGSVIQPVNYEKQEMNGKRTTP